MFEEAGDVHGVFQRQCLVFRTRRGSPDELDQHGSVPAQMVAVVQDKWIRNLLENRSDLKPEQLERTRGLMDKHVPDALVSGYESLIEGLQLPDSGDRHVLAAAIRGRADVIVTGNLKDFPAEILVPFGIEAQHPDEFVLHLLDLAPGVVCRAADHHRQTLKTRQGQSKNIWIGSKRKA